jgi:antitoxin Phd
MATWQLQTAKNRLSAVVRDAEKKGPQIITKNGVETAVLLSFKDYKRMNQRKTNLVEFFQNSPLAGIDFEVDRSADKDREIDL